MMEMDNKRKQEWARCIVTSAMEIGKSADNKSMEWPIKVLQMSIDKLKREIKEN